jgi:hypothetical protein
VVEVEPRLVPLFARALPDATVVPATDPPHPAARAADIDCQAPFGSLCRWRRRELADFRPEAYLSAEPAAATVTRARYAGDPRPRVGIAWQSHLHGSPQAKRFGRAKSCPLLLWQPILARLGLRFFSLQYGDVAASIDPLTARFGTRIEVDKTVDQLASLDALAAQIAALDLVITVSTTVAHVAGAMGVPTWVLLPHNADWRWQAAGADSLWYPTVRLFRQPRPADWPAVTAAVAEALAERFECRPAADTNAK